MQCNLGKRSERLGKFAAGKSVAGNMMLNYSISTPAIIKSEEKRPGVVAGVRRVQSQSLLLPQPVSAMYHLVIIPLCAFELSPATILRRAAQNALCAALQLPS